MSDFETFKQAVFGQESGNGKAKTDKPNYAGALGEGQILESTFKGLQRNGKVPTEYEWKNPEHNKFAAEQYMDEAWQASGANPALAAAYYYGGPKAIKGGQIVSYKDKLNPNAPDTVAYSNQVLARMGQQPGPVGPSAQVTLAKLRASIQRPSEYGIDNATLERQLQQGLQAQAEQSAANEANRPGWLEMVGAGMAGNTDNQLVEAIFRDKFAPVEGYVPDMQVMLKQTNGQADQDLIDDYRDAKSPQEAQHLMDRYEEEKIRTKALFSNGTTIGTGLALTGEVAALSNWVPGVAASKLLALGKMGSAALAAQGASKGSVIASAATENLLGGTAVEALRQGLTGHFSPADLGLSILLDTTLGGVMGALDSRTAGMATFNRATEQVMAREVAYHQRAEQALGRGATVEEIAGEVQRIKTQELADVPESAKASLHESDKIVPAWQRPSWPEQAENADVGAKADEYPALPLTEVGVGSEVSKRKAPDTPEFQNFFSGSKAVDAKGEPVIVYHGTLADIGAFSKELLGTNTGAKSASDGFFFAGNPATTNAYTQGRAGSNVIPAYLSLKNPLIYDAGGETRRSIRFAEITAQARKDGHDGVIIKNTYDGGPKDNIYVAFDETQIKSAVGNVGTYDPTDPRISYSPGKEAPVGGPVTATAPVKEALTDALNSPALLNEATPDSRGTRQLISHLLKVLPASVLKKTVNFRGAGERGAYNWITGSIDSPGTSAGALSPKGTSPNQAVILAHEVVHAATANMIEAVQSGAAGVTNDMRKAVNNLEIIRKDLEAELKKVGKLDKTSGFGANYATKNLHEFVAQVMSDAETRTILAGMPSKGFVDKLSEFANAVLRLLGFNAKSGDTALQEAVTLVEQIIKEGPPPEAPRAVMTRVNGPQPAEVVNELLTDPMAVKIGLNLAPMNTAKERADVQAMVALHKKAAEWEIKNPMDAEYMKRVKNLADNNVFNVASTGLIMLRSQNPVARMIASELLEDASGVMKNRRATAAITKYTVEKLMLGNSVVEFQRAFKYWKKDQKAGWLDDMVGGKNWDTFNRAVAEEREARLVAKGPVSKDPSIKGAADVLDAAYQRTANEQRRVGTLGSEGLPLSSVGYMPHRMSAKRVINLTPARMGVLHQALTDQFMNLGWDTGMADKVASSYLARVRDRATGDYSSSVGGNSQGTYGLVEEALKAMELPTDVVAKHMEKFNKGAANYTKKRIELDLNKVYATPEGDFKLMDIFETNQIELLRSQVGRASGEVALTKHGVQGKPGLTLLRDAISYGEGNKMATDQERDAFDQTAAEFMNEPFGKAGGKWMERAMAANTLVRLGGIAYNQLAESINAIVHVGVSGAMGSVASIPRMRKEIRDLVAGKQVDNPWLTSIEAAGGEFGTDAYKTVMPFDSPDHAYPTYGQDTITVTDRLLRGGSHVQSILSGWRLIHSAQQRGMAEQIVKKVARYVNEGKDDIALQQFGITPEVQKALKADLHLVTQFDARGNPMNFDVTKITDPAIREQVIQAVWRGTNQIIQGTFIGERGKWAHDGWMKLMTQFRTFSLTSMEKQWGRQRNSRGGMEAFAILVGSMTFAVPIYMARVYASSIDRPDQQEYIDKNTTPEHIARATLNYVAMSGLVGDFTDMITAAAPDSWGITPTGGRAGVASTFVGNYVAPASSLVDDIWKATQKLGDVDEDGNPVDPTNDLLKLFPGSRLPYILPLVNSTKE